MEGGLVDSPGLLVTERPGVPELRAPPGGGQEGLRTGEQRAGDGFLNPVKLSGGGRPPSVPLLGNNCTRRRGTEARTLQLHKPGHSGSTKELSMEGEKETAEEKEEEEKEEEEKQLHPHVAVASPMDYQDRPIIHWEDLSQRIAELEKQEQDRRERSKKGTGGRMEESRGGAWRDVWEEEEGDLRRCRVAVVTSRFLSHRNLQLCFINSSDSDDEDDGSNKKVAMGTERGLKQEVAGALRRLRDELLEEQRRKEHPAGSSTVARRKHLERLELDECSVQQLSSSRASLQQEVHALSSELVAHLLVRDQLRTKQDAVLLDVQDLT
ncbi:unnamed protein product [Pleuronectes platessa]|uniref:Schwannomin interacting protein 1 C-terminal domain-containing protein n=1 Tax=Pleuronectes platessa TaxID=8262 RepID=A0A9N7UBL3_PLEPL|nr:unnamed protein product [Pleuronectes platessa]